MTGAFAFPNWVPPWAQLLILIIGILLGLTFLLMPFSVFGVKSRLEAVEARLDEIQGEIRALVLRLPEAGRRSSFDDEPYLSPPAVSGQAPVHPPIPPAAWAVDVPPRRPTAAGPARVEPRIDRTR